MDHPTVNLDRATATIAAILLSVVMVALVAQSLNRLDQTRQDIQHRIENTP